MTTTADPRPPASGELASTRAFALASQVDYVPGSVVSRTIAKKPAGTIALFAFGAAQGLSEHSPPFDAFVQVVDDVGTKRAIQDAPRDDPRL